MHRPVGVEPLIGNGHGFDTPVFADWVVGHVGFALFLFVNMWSFDLCLDLNFYLLAHFRYAFVCNLTILPPSSIPCQSILKCPPQYLPSGL